MTINASARSVIERCDILGSYSEEPDCLTRPFASPAMRKANEAVAAWMQAAGMSVQQDRVGNLIRTIRGGPGGCENLAARFSS